MEDMDILKKCRAYNSSHDILYYIIRKKQPDTYAVVCAPCNYLYQNDQDQFFGVCVYASENNISDAMRREFPFRKTFFGIPMVKTTVKHDGRELISLDNRQIRELPFCCRLDSVPRFPSSFIPAYTCFECEDVIDIIEPKTAQMELCRRDKDFRFFMDELTERFEIKPEQIGITGSLALGAETAGDYDIIFYGDRAELRRINDVIADINRRQGMPKLSGLPLPFRFKLRDCMVDALFVDEAADLDELHTARQIRANVPFRCRVTDDTAALQVEPFFGVENEEFSYLLIAETFFHAVIRTGDIIEGSGDILRWDRNGKTEYIMLCRDPFRQLTDYTRYFYR